MRIVLNCSVQRIPMAGFVGMNLGIGRHDGPHESDALGFRLRDGGHRAALTLASDDDDAALAGLMLRLAAIDAVFNVVGRADVATDIGTIHFNRAREVSPSSSEAMASRSL